MEKMSQKIVMVVKKILDGDYHSREKKVDSPQACDGRVKRTPFKESSKVFLKKAGLRSPTRGRSSAS